MAKLSAPRSRTILRATATARLSPSTANGTSSIRGVAPGTNVIMGCKEAVLAPLCFSGESTSLLSAPLECNTILPAHPALRASSFAVSAKASSVWQIQTMSEVGPASFSDCVCASSVPASIAARLRDEAVSRAATKSILYPAALSAGPSAWARLPAPIKVIVALSARLLAIQRENIRSCGQTPFETQRNRGRGGR